MRGLVLAEKPSLMRAIESAYKSGGTFPFTLDFAAFHGHLMRMAMPGDYCDEWGGPWEEKYLDVYKRQHPGRRGVQRREPGRIPGGS